MGFYGVYTLEAGESPDDDEPEENVADLTLEETCVGNETKPKGGVWKWFKKVPAEKHGGPLGLQCLGAGCPKIYFKAIPNATKLARHAAACCALPQAALEDPDSEGPILIE
ncbi:hypothetical protein M885DRAFT_626623 [Pelagophyceae sp. CCMP2097]|nr:hypothetical protein M885DRAFT_626623 [Pelagophyceae sp. CCMP2097]